MHRFNLYHPLLSARFHRLAVILALSGMVMTASAAPLPEQTPTQSQPQSQPSPAASNASASTSAVSGQPPVATAEGERPVWERDQLTGTWGGARSWAADHGITLSPSWTGEVFGNPSGGRRRGVISDGLFNVQLDLDLRRLSGSAALDDTLIHANALYIYGAGLSPSFVGDFSNTSNINAYNSARLQELWLQRQFLGQRVSVKVGNIAVDTEYFLANSSSLFMSGTFGAFTLLPNNVVNAPTYPLASPGLRFKLLPTPQFYFQTGVFGMDRGSNPAVNNKYGTRFALDSGSGVLIVSETGFLLNQAPQDHGLIGTYKVGAFVNTANASTFISSAEDATEPHRKAGTNYGVYGVMDQQIFASGCAGISLFARAGMAPSNTNFINAYVDGGFNFTGFVAGRTQDIAGLALARSRISRDYGRAEILEGEPGSTAETVIEATYKAQINPWWYVQPDFQYIVTPGGQRPAANATVIGVRTGITF